jgi:hypothetical protein
LLNQIGEDGVLELTPPICQVIRLKALFGIEEVLSGWRFWYFTIFPHDDASAEA